MTHEIQHQSTFAVIDSLLPALEFNEISSLADHTLLRPVDRNIAVWKRTMASENPRTGMMVIAYVPEVREEIGDAQLMSHGIGLYPTGNALDPFLSALIRQAGIHSSVVGRERTDWTGVLARYYSYGVGSRIDWHTDDRVYTGAFVYYCHRMWRSDWGGDLLLEDQGSSSGTYIRPISNRLVLLKAGTRHCVSRILGSAGQARRVSIAGFFATREHLEAFPRDAPSSHALTRPGRVSQP